MLKHQKSTILVVEDDALDFRILKKAIDATEKKFPIEHFESGPDVLSYLKEWSPGNPSIAAIFLDLKMPIMSGLEVLEELRKDDKTKYIPVIMISASTFDKDISTAYELGANAYMAKPMDRQEFYNAIGHLIGFWGEVNHRHPDI